MASTKKNILKVEVKNIATGKEVRFDSLSDKEVFSGKLLNSWGEEIATGTFVLIAAASDDVDVLQLKPNFGETFCVSYDATVMNYVPANKAVLAIE